MNLSNNHALKQEMPQEERETAQAQCCLDGAGAITIVLSANGTILGINKRGGEILGGGENNLRGRNWFETFIPERFRDAARQSFLEFVAGRSTETNSPEIPILTNGGRERVIRWSSELVRDENGRFICAISSGEDVTEKEQIEEHRRANEERAQLALDTRTAELQDVNRELENFSYSVAHDLRAPLRAIDGYSRMILKKAHTLDEDTRQHFTAIRCNAQMLGQLIDDLLVLSRLSRKEIVASRIDMYGLVLDVWKELQIMYPERSIEFQIKDLPPCRGDQSLIRQVCFNLLSNAVKFTKFRKPAKIEVGGRAGGDEIEYYVKDNGIGLDMVYYKKLFGVFQRLHGTEDFAGTGVGLAVVQRILHRHAGRVWAEGEPDHGACFHFALPGKE